MDRSRAVNFNYDDLTVLLGQTLESASYRDFAKRLPEEPRANDLGFATYLMLEDLGFHVRSDNEERRVTSITIWNANLRYKQFKGLLPRGISFADNQDEVNKKLGLPSRRGKCRGLNFPPEPKVITDDRDESYQEWVTELEKQPVSDLVWCVYKFEPYELRLDFDMSENGKLRLIIIEYPPVVCPS